MRCAKAARRRRPRSRRSLPKLIENAPRRVAVTTFASNVARIRAVADAARKADREVVVVGRAMDRVIGVARETGYLEGVQPFRGMDVYGHLPPDKVVALCTGSQGEPRAALARIAAGRASRGGAVARRPGDLLVAAHSRQREGDRPRHQRPDRPGRRGHHRPHPSGARVRPSAPRRARGDDRLGQARDRHPGARRVPASRRARGAGAQARRQHAAMPQRRPGAARARRARHRRRGAGRPALQGRRAAGRGGDTHRRRAKAHELCRHDLRVGRGQRQRPAPGRSRGGNARHPGTDRRRQADVPRSPPTPCSKRWRRCRGRAAAIRIRSPRRCAEASAPRSARTGARSRTSRCTCW